MKITENDIRQVADISKLALTEDWVQSMTGDIQNILHYADDKFSTFDTDSTQHVNPMEKVTSNRNVFRDDVYKDSLERTEILKNASAKKDGYFKVPKVMEGN